MGWENWRKYRFIWTIYLDINYIQQQFLMHGGYFKENKQFLQNVLLFASSNMATLPTHKCLTYSAQNKHYSYGLPVQLENCYLQTIQTGSYLHKAFVTEKCIISYDKSENYNDHPTYDDKIIIYNVLLKKFVYQDCITVRLGSISKSYNPST